MNAFDSATIAGWDDSEEAANQILDSANVWYYQEVGDTVTVPSRAEAVAYLKDVALGNVTLDSPWNDTKNDTAIMAHISATEEAFMDSCIAVFGAMDLSSYSYFQAAVAIRDKANALITVWGSKNFGSEPADGELSRGFLDIAASSADYWKDRGEEFPTPSYGIVAAVIWMDAVGYIAGWVIAVAVELIETGKLSEDNEWNRIGAGGRTAFTLSMGKYGGIKNPFEK